MTTLESAALQSPGNREPLNSDNRHGTGSDARRPGNVVIDLN